MKISARKQLKAMVKCIMPGAVNAEVVLTLAGGQEVVATITNASVKSLGLVQVRGGYTVIKASRVPVAVD